MAAAEVRSQSWAAMKKTGREIYEKLLSSTVEEILEDDELLMVVSNGAFYYKRRTLNEGRGEALQKGELEMKGKKFEKLIVQLSDLLLLSAKQTLSLIQDAFKTSTHEQASMVPTLLADDGNPLTADDVKSKTIAFYFEDRLYRTRAQELLLARLFGDPDPSRQDGGADAMEGGAAAAEEDFHDPLSLDELERAWDAAEEAWESASAAAAKTDATEKTQSSGEYRIDPNMVVLAMTPGGSTLVTIADKPLDKLAAEVGHGCKIEYSKEDRSLLNISAKGPTAVARAKLALEACVSRQELRKARRVYTEVRRLAHNALAQYATNPLLAQLNPPKQSMTHESKRRKSSNPNVKGSEMSPAVAKHAAEEGDTEALWQKWLTPQQREQWVHQLLLEKQACVRTLIVYISSDLYDPGFEEDGDDADLDGGADEPQPQILNCVVHFFETRFDPFDGAPVDRTAKWIAPLYDRVAFYEIILGLQLLDAPTMIHDSQVEAEDVRMYLETFSFLEEILQKGCVELSDDRLAPLMLVWGALLRKLAPASREHRKPVGANQFWDESRLWAGEYCDWAGFVNCGLRCKNGRPFDLLLRCMDRENPRSFVEHLNSDSPPDVLVEDIVVSTVYKFLGVLSEVHGLPQMCADVAIQQDVIKLLTHVYDRHFSAPLQLGRAAPPPGRTGSADNESPRGLTAFASGLVGSFWDYVDDPTGSDGIVENIYTIVLHSERSFPAPGWVSLFVDLITTLSGFAHFETAVDDAANPDAALFDFHPLERVVEKLSRMRFYGFLYDPEDRQRPAEEFVLGDRASGGIQEFPMHLTMLRQTQAFGWRVPLPAAGEVLVSIKDGDAFAYQLTSLEYAYSAWEYFAVCLLNMQKALRAGPDADNIGTEQEEQCIAIIRMIRCLYHQQDESRRVEAAVRRFLSDGLDERRWGLPELTVSVGNHSTTPLLELVLVICRYSTKDQAPLPRVGAACIACISAAADTAPAVVCRSLSTSQFEAFTQWPGSFKDSVLDDVLPADRRTEDYSATVWCLRLIRSLVTQLAEITRQRVGAAGFAANPVAWHDVCREMREYMGFLAQILVEFESIRAEKLRQKGQIGALLLETFMHILDPPGGLQPGSILAQLNKELREDLHTDAKYNNKGQARALVELLAKGHRQISIKSPLGNGRTQWVYLLRLAFRVLEKVLDQPSEARRRTEGGTHGSRQGTNLTQLQVLLLVGRFDIPAEGSQAGPTQATSFVVSVADYLALNRDRVPNELPTAAIRVLRRVLDFSASHSVSGTIGELNRVECRECKLGLSRAESRPSRSRCIQCHLHELFWLRLEERTANRPSELAEAILLCITACIRTQAGLARRLLDFSRPTSVAKSERKLLLESAISDKKTGKSARNTKEPLRLGSRSCLREVLRIIETQGKRANSFLGHTPRVPAAAASLVREMWRRQLGTAVLREQGTTNSPKMKIPFWMAFIQPLEFEKKSLPELAEKYIEVRPTVHEIANAGEGFKIDTDYNVVDTAGRIEGAKARVLKVSATGGVIDLEISSKGKGWGTSFVSCAITASEGDMDLDASSSMMVAATSVSCKFSVRCVFSDPRGGFLQWHYQSIAQSAVLDVLTMEAWRKGDNAAIGSPHTEVARLHKGGVGWVMDDGVLPFCGGELQQEAFTIALQYDTYVSAQVELVAQWRRFVTLATAGVGKAPQMSLSGRSHRQPCYGVPDLPGGDGSAAPAVRTQLEQQAIVAIQKQSTLLLELVGRVASALRVVSAQLIDSRTRLPQHAANGVLQMSTELAELLLVLTTRASAAGVDSVTGEEMLANLGSVLALLPTDVGGDVDTLRVLVQSTVVAAVPKFWTSARGRDPVLGIQTKAGEIIGLITAYLDDNLHFRGSSSASSDASAGAANKGDLGGSTRRVPVTPISSAVATLVAILTQMTAAQKENIALRVFTRSAVLETVMVQLSQCLSTMTDVYFTRKALLLLMQLVGGTVDSTSDEPGAASKSATRRCAHVVNLSKVSGGGYGGILSSGVTGGGLAEHIITGTRNLHLFAASTSSSGRLDTYDGGRRNPWHSVWCLTLLVQTNALRTLGRTDDTLADAIIFANVHKHVFVAALAVFPLNDGRKVTAGELDEAVAVMKFLSELTRYPEFLRVSPETVLAEGGMADCVLRTLKGCVYFAGRGSLEELCEWISPEDGERPLHAAHRKGSRTPRDKYFGEMEDRAHALARACLTFLKNISMPPPATWVTDGGVASLMTSGDLVAQYRLFAPYDEADPDDPNTVSLDTLVDYLTACRSLVKYGDRSDYAALTYGMEVAAIIIVSQGTHHLNSGEIDMKSWSSFLHRVYDCFFRGTTNRVGSSRGSLSSHPRSFSAGFSPSPTRSPRGTPALLDESAYLLRQTDDRTVVDLLRRLREYCEVFHQ